MKQSPPSTKLPPDYAGVLFAALLMIIVGWYGLYTLVTTQIPRVGQRWLFFVLLHIAVTGTVMPFVRYLNIRLTPITRPLPSGGVIVRQSVWIGIFVVTCAWLQIPRVLTVPIMFFLALAFGVIEVFLRSREMGNEQ
ncbi:MAG: hypothetical protein IPK17_36550 [Chloroflexi bacterium]|uniref:hypothetical protein n=1 Tax=Candidatus Flexifilum breve TaxID=3140694 RepID=UPI003134F095|nr:hypothetical protein [Chloroflexota bacterium]